MNVLRLNLKSKWYNMIESGVKTEEYREIKDFYLTRLIDDSIIKVYNDLGFDGKKSIFARIEKEHGDLTSFIKKYDQVVFVYGYTKKTMTFEVKEIKIDTGNTDWGAEEGKEYFIIRLGKRIK